jgi:hypothetical protein
MISLQFSASWISRRAVHVAVEGVELVLGWTTPASSAEAITATFMVDRG